MISNAIKSVIRDVNDFPKPGIVFKDVTPIFKEYQLCSEIVDAFVEKLQGIRIDSVAGIESRGFLFGLMIANKLEVPFFPVRKVGKLPFTTVQQKYELEYGEATIEIHKDAFKPGQHILVHDDLLATGGTAEATSKLIQKLGGKIAAYSFVIGLNFLNGAEKLKLFSDQIITLAEYR